MKKITLALVALTLSASAFAKSDQQFCEEVSVLSTTIMTGRQNGVPLIDALKLANKPEFAEIKEPVIGIVKMAYKEPRFSTDKVKQETITEFANKIMLKCLVEMKG